MVVNLAFHMEKNLSDSCLQFGHAPSESSTSPAVGCRCLRNIGMKGHQILAYPGHPCVSAQCWLKVPYISSDTSVDEVVLLVRG